MFGGVVLIPSEDMRVNDVEKCITSYNATWAFLTPSVANLIEPTAVPGLEVLVCGGEAMSVENVLKWASHVALINGYGPTEATVIALSNKAVSQERNPANIGNALAGNRTWIASTTDPKGNYHFFI